MVRTCFANANLLDGESPAQAGVSVVVEGGRIVAVGQLTAAPDDTVVDLAGRTLMPGMVSGHFHASYFNEGDGKGALAAKHPPIYTGYLAMTAVQAALASGFTSVVGAGGSFDIDASLSRAIEDGLVKGPRMIPAGRDLQTSADAGGWWMGTPNAQGAFRLCDGPDDFRRGVRAEIARGAKMIKIFVTGGHGVLQPYGTEIVSREELEAVVQAAHDRGARVRTHITSKARILHAVECGVDVLDHADDMDEECIEAIAKAGTFVLPSLLFPLRFMEHFTRETPEDGVSGEARSFRSMCAMLPKAAKAGVRLCVGDDYGVLQMPHGEYAKELAVYVEHAGIDPLEVIRWATRNGGALMGRDDLGRIAPGMLADLVVLDGDPSQDIRVLDDPARILAVIKGGRVEHGSLEACMATSARRAA
jgi:imidazolonepropionase-like amidohydrolase